MTTAGSLGILFCFVSGHDFSRAVLGQNDLGFSPCQLVTGRESAGALESALKPERNSGPLRSGRKTFPRKIRGTADPSATLRSGRDDKGKGSASIQIGCCGRRTAGPSTTLRFGRDDTLVWVPTSQSKEKCHPNRSAPGFPATQHWTRRRMRLSVRERRMKCNSTTKFHRKSGERSGGARCSFPSQALVFSITASGCCAYSAQEPSYRLTRSAPAISRPRAMTAAVTPEPQVVVIGCCMSTPLAANISRS